MIINKQPNITAPEFSPEAVTLTFNYGINIITMIYSRPPLRLLLPLFPLPSLINPVISDRDPCFCRFEHLIGHLFDFIQRKHRRRKRIKIITLIDETPVAG